MNAGDAPVLAADAGVVGAGPGGLAAAVALAQGGLSVAVLDEAPRPGGQIFRQLPSGFGAAPHAARAAPAPGQPPSHAAGHRLLAAADAAHLHVIGEAVVWDAAPGRLWFEHAGRSRLLRCRSIVLAPGAYDRCIPFPGWTLPGVITAGAAQVMVRGFAVRPGARALVAGTGPLLLPTVTALLAAGVEVVAALEAAPRAAMLAALPGVLRSGARLREALFYARELLRRGVRLRWGHTVFAVEGAGRVERAVFGRVDRDGRPRRGTARSLEVDVVCAGFGLVPSIELAQRLGCETVHDPVRGGWRVVAGDGGATNIEGVHAVGEIAGVGGAEVAAAEGRAAAAAVLAALRGRPVDKALQAAASRQRRAADALLRAFPVLPGLFELAAPETVVCRCEDVTVGEVRAAAALHGATARAIKMGCRAGMGPCQARICGPNLQACVDAAAVPDRPVVQVPVKVVAAGTIVGAPPG